MAGWLSGSALISINELTVRRARLVLGLVTICWRVDHLRVSPSHPGQLSLLPSAGRKMSTSRMCGGAMRLGSKGRYGSCHLWINVWVSGYPSLTHALPERDAILAFSTFTFYAALAKSKRQPAAASYMYAIEIACQFGVSRVRGCVGVRVGVLLFRIQRASASSRLLISVHPLGKLFTPLCRRHQAVLFGTGQWTVTLCGWECNRRSGAFPGHTLSGLPPASCGLKAYKMEKSLSSCEGMWHPLLLTPKYVFGEPGLTFGCQSIITFLNFKVVQ